MAKQETLNITDFTQHPRVLACVKRLKEYPWDHDGNGPLVSDVVDEYGHQYVDLVQKGGGVLGVALVGYTYILESMGIRFRRLAGTSAGAINTSLMTIIGEKQDAKSEKILDIITRLNFFDLVDGHPFARLVIRNFITNKGFTSKVKAWGRNILLMFGLLLLSDFVLFGLEKSYTWLHTATMTSFVLTGFYLVFLICVASYLAGLMKRFKNAGLGINPGDFFYDWLKKNMADNGVRTVSDLKAKAEAPIPGLKIREPRTDRVDDLVCDVTFIASELVTANKIEFPRMCDLFKPPARIDELSPAGFVRASMSIPVFFESYYINKIDVGNPDIKAAWDKHFEIQPPHTARFVDGGILSNFPISIFFNPNAKVPRLPTFGIDLDDSDPKEKTPDPYSWSLTGFAGRMFNTIRYYYDKDFLLKNRILDKGIGKVPLFEFNWLNFFMKKDEKIEMFVRGAEAATDFLLKFSWDDYKQDRSKVTH